MELEWVMNDKKFTIYCYEEHCDLYQWIMNDKGHNQGIMNDRKSQFIVMNNIMSHIVNDSLCSSKTAFLLYFFNLCWTTYYALKTFSGNHYLKIMEKKQILDINGKI